MCKRSTFMRTIGGVVAAVLTLATADLARADLILGNFASTPTALNTMRRYAEDGASLGVVGQGGETTQGISLGPNGNLYVVSNNFGQGRIEQFHPVTGASLGVLVNEDWTLQGPYQGPDGIAFGIDGHCYSTATPSFAGVHGVVKFHGTTGEYLGVVIAPNTNGLTTPTDVLTMPGGDLLVSDGTRINRYDGATLAFKGTLVAPGAGGISSITKYTVGPDGDLYVSSWTQNAVYRFDGDTGAPMGTFVPSVFEPVGLTFGNDGHLYVVSDFGLATVRRFDGLTGAPLGTVLAPNPDYHYGYYLITVPEPATLGVCGVMTFFSIRRSRRRAGAG